MAISDVDLWLMRKQFSSKKRFSIYKKLIKFLKSGVQLPVALDIMYEHAIEGKKKPKKTPVTVALSEWRRNVRNGQSFSRAIKGWAPDKERIVIEAGEVAGRLDMAIENAVFVQEGAAKFRSAILGGIAYPLFLVAAIFLFMYIFGSKVIPAFDEAYSRDNWTGLAAQMAWLADFVRDGLLQTIAGLLGLIFLFLFTLPRWTGKLRSRFDRYPPWSLYRLTMGAGFLLGISAMHRAGIAVSQALLILMREANPWYRERVYETLRHVRNGQNLGEALYRTGFGFPDREIVLDLRSYAELQGFDEVLDEMGRSWMESSIETIQAQARVMRMVALFAVAGVFVWMITGVFALQDQVQSGIQMMH